MVSCSAAVVPVQATTLGRGPVHRSVDIPAVDGVSIESYVRQHHADHGSAAAEPRLWGLKADSRLPVTRARAQVEYAVWMPPDRGQDGLAEDDNRMFQARLEDRGGPLRYGGRVFSVGQAFPHHPIGRDQLNAAGLAGPGDGAELWLGGRLPLVDLRPRLTRALTSGPNATTERHSLHLARSVQLGARSRLICSIESSTADTRLHGGGDALHRETGSAVVNLTRSAWSTHLRNTRIDHELASGGIEAITQWELGSAIALPARFDDMHLGVRLHHVQRQPPDAGPLSRLEADLTLRTPLRLWNRAGPGPVMTTAIGYRAAEAGAAAADAGVSFRIRVDFAPWRR